MFLKPRKRIAIQFALVVVCALNTGCPWVITRIEDPIAQECRTEAAAENFKNRPFTVAPATIRLTSYGGKPSLRSTIQATVNRCKCYLTPMQIGGAYCRGCQTTCADCIFKVTDAAFFQSGGHPFEDAWEYDSNTTPGTDTVGVDVIFCGCRQRPGEPKGDGRCGPCAGPLNVVPTKATFKITVINRENGPCYNGFFDLTGRLTFWNKTGNSVELEGTVLDPFGALELQPTDLDFGQVVANYGCITKEIEILNKGGLDLAGDVTSNQPVNDWKLTLGPYTLPASTTPLPSSLRLPQTFQPVNSGSLSIQLTVTGAGGAKTATLRGVGVDLVDAQGVTDIAGWKPKERGWGGGWTVLPNTRPPAPPAVAFKPLEGFGDAAPGTTLPGDFNGDGWTDLAAWNAGRLGWDVILSTGNGFGGTRGAPWIDGFGGPGPGFMLTGDFNGDGATDIAGWSQDYKGWHVARSTKRGFDSGAGECPDGIWIRGFGGPDPGFMLTGDFNGDRATDIAGWNEEHQAWHVARSSEKCRFDPSPGPCPDGMWIKNFGAPSPGLVLTGDFNDDRRTDIARWNENDKGWGVALSTGCSFGGPGSGSWIKGFGGPEPGFMLTGDFNGDRKTDIAGWNRDHQGWHIALSDGIRFDSSNQAVLTGIGGPENGWTLTGDFASAAVAVCPYP